MLYLSLWKRLVLLRDGPPVACDVQDPKCFVSIHVSEWYKYKTPNNFFCLTCLSYRIAKMMNLFLHWPDNKRIEILIKNFCRMWKCYSSWCHGNLSFTCLFHSLVVNRFLDVICIISRRVHSLFLSFSLFRFRLVKEHPLLLVSWNKRRYRTSDALGLTRLWHHAQEHQHDIEVLCRQGLGGYDILRITSS